MTADIISIVFIALFVNNFVLTQFLGLCPFVGVSSTLSSAIGMSFATSCVMTIASACGFITSQYLLKPLALEYLLPFFSIIIIALLVQGLEIVIAMMSPLLFKVLGIYLPLITSNCAVLAISLIVARRHDSLTAATVEGLATGAGFSLVLIMFAAMRERIALCNAPKYLAGTPLTIFTIAISSLAFMGFVGIGQ